MSFLASLRALGGARGRLADALAAAPGFAAPAKLRLEEVSGMGLGVVAAEPLSAGETVMRVPQALWRPFSADYALDLARARAPPFVARCEALASQMAAQGIAGASKLPLHVALALQLVFEAGNPAASGHAYAASLPAPDAPALWPAEALAALAGTRTHAAVLARRGFVHTVHEALFGAGGGIPRERFAWALAVVLSRALSGTGAPYTLVPAVDLLNHGDTPTVAHSFHADEFVVTTLRPHARGEQLLLSYGAGLCNDRTLRLYGFATRSNPHDAAMLPPPWPAPSASDPLAAHKAHWLSRDDVAAAPAAGAWWSAEADAAPVPVRGAGDGEALLAALRVMHAAPEDLPAPPQLPPPPLDASRPLNARNEAAARESLARAARAAMARYPSTLAQTERALAEPAGDDNPIAARRLRAALAVRAGEQRALDAVLRCAESKA